MIVIINKYNRLYLSLNYITIIYIHNLLLTSTITFSLAHCKYSSSVRSRCSAKFCIKLQSYLKTYGRNVMF